MNPARPQLGESFLFHGRIAWRVVALLGLPLPGIAGHCLALPGIAWHYLAVLGGAWRCLALFTWRWNQGTHTKEPRNQHQEDKEP